MGVDRGAPRPRASGARRRAGRRARGRTAGVDRPARRRRHHRLERPVARRWRFRRRTACRCSWRIAVTGRGGSRARRVARPRLARAARDGRGARARVRRAPADLVAAIGPSISAARYEVDVDVRRRFEAAGFTTRSARAVVPRRVAAGPLALRRLAGGARPTAGRGRRRRRRFTSPRSARRAIPICCVRIAATARRPAASPARSAPGPVPPAAGPTLSEAHAEVHALVVLVGGAQGLVLIVYSIPSAVRIVSPRMAWN